MDHKPILLSAPHFSEGRDQKIIDAIINSIKSIPEIKILDINVNYSANRTVVNFAGAPNNVLEAAYNAIKVASELIDMAQQHGNHPRIGATDVCPLIPFSGIGMEETVLLSEELAKKVGITLGVPVYLYENTAKEEHRRELPDIRRGQYEGLCEKMKQKDWTPDYGPHVFNPKTGATIIGARSIIVALNISLETKDLLIAKHIAERIRESGHLETINGEKQVVKGLFPKLRSIGWYRPDMECVQVSVNILDYKVSSPLKVYEAIEAIAKGVGISITGSEIAGLIPEACLIEAGIFYYMKKGWNIPDDTQLLVHSGITFLGLSKHQIFDPKIKVLEYALSHAGLL